MNREIAAQVTEALDHAAKAYAAQAVAAGAQFFGRDAFAGIAGFENQAGAFGMYANRGGLTGGMAMHVGETLLGNAKDGRFDFGGQATEFRGDFHSHFDLAALRKFFDVPTKSGSQAEFIEQGD